ncbi:4-hydroxybutyrate dehydrogenase [Peptoniphilus stercorisuis]|uniref:4-hydroxybutyrate dehydrogenase n=1 Tax=Peptoniphilus stercorisuis TaxID=1436965 RepID=A0ABS4KDR9_9FIRM|nr:4-hydroxybutyrate dehydrogenase [Peptoniphilus stercorisuis]MBP2025913.1 4-hydroxybutyrate dehydrogenase [Peptoniphilus stercorisuis]
MTTIKQIILKTELYKFNKVTEFINDFKIDENDLILTNEYIFIPYFKELNIKANVIFQEKYGNGEPTDEMFERIYLDISKLKEYRRVIGVGGGTIMDLAKILALKNCSPVEDLFSGNIKIEKDKELILIPTTCGTGSEVTNISILSFVSKNTKIGLAVDEMYADKAVILPELLEGLPFQFFASSSIDALIHAVESSLSPKSTEYTELFSYKAIEKIIKGYQYIVENGEESRKNMLEEFLIASNYAGIAFGTAGCATVHALSYPLSGTFHVPHGEANYAVFIAVMKKYMTKKSDGKIKKLNIFLANLLECDEENVYNNLELLLNKIIYKKTLKEYGANIEILEEWTKNVLETQQRLIVNSFVPLNSADILDIYKSLN